MSALTACLQPMVTGASRSATCKWSATSGRLGISFKVGVAVVGDRVPMDAPAAFELPLPANMREPSGPPATPPMHGNL